jgi:Ca2+-binding EF-hand superfamily protein
MRAFDGDGNGRVDYEEFLRSVRGRLSPTRKKMVRQIFDALDKIGGDLGYLTIAAIQPVYSVSNHPQVKAGKMTKEEALQEFLNGFEGSQGNRDGRVTLDEWIKYYEEVRVPSVEIPCIRSVAHIVWLSCGSCARVCSRARVACSTCTWGVCHS